MVLGVTALALALATPDLPEEADASAHTAFVYQGFSHDWLRRVAGLFAVPHRVSLFRSGVTEARHRHTADGLVSEGEWTFGQSTGVDGDYMRPQGFASRVHAPDVHMQRGTVRFEAFDRTDGSPAPRAFARFHDLIVADVPPGEATHAVALLQGLSFRSRCLDEDGACNSHGIWPYRFLVALQPCEPVDGLLVCPVTAEVGRAWTPGRGGVKGIEEKPLNERMGVEIEVDYVLLSGASAALASQAFLFQNALHSDRYVRSAEQRVDVPVPGEGRYPAATVGLTSIGYEFFPTARGRDARQRGRYIAGWHLHARQVAHDPQEGRLTLGHAGRIWLPRTVRRTGVAFEVGMAVVLLGHPDATVHEVDPITGLLCADSDGAPAFSRWEKCEGISDGAVRTEQSVRFGTGPR